MRVLHVIGGLNPASGGPSSVIVSVSAAQAAGHAVTVLTTRETAAAGPMAKATATIPHFGKVTILDIEPQSGRLNMFTPVEPGQLKALMANCDIVHLHGLWEPILLQVSRAARSAGKPYVITPHGMLDTWALKKSRLKKAVALYLVGYLSMIKHAAAHQALSSHEAECITNARYGPPIETLPNGVFLEQIDPLPAIGTFRASSPQLQAFVGADPYIIFLARLAPGKGLAIIADALGLLAPKHPRLKWLIAGPDFGARAPLQAQLAELGIADHVRLLGPIYDKSKFAAMVDAACFVLPSEHEGFSMSIVEAMACGCPVVISPQCHFNQVAEHQAGFTVPRTAAANAQAIDTILSDPQAALAMSQRARSLVQARYTWPAVAQAMIQWYERLLASR